MRTAMHLVPLAGVKWASSKMRDAVAAMLDEVASQLVGVEVDMLPPRLGV